MPDALPELERFVRGELDPANFPHREHLRMGFEMLRRHDFAETAYHYSLGLRRMTARAGKPQAVQQTVTIAFLSLIAERMLSSGIDEFSGFVQANPDLLDKATLAQLYRPERLSNDAARRIFLLPDRAR